MPRLDVFGNVVTGYDRDLGRPVTVPPMGPHMIHYAGEQRIETVDAEEFYRQYPEQRPQPVEAYPGQFEPPQPGALIDEVQKGQDLLDNMMPLPHSAGVICNKAAQIVSGDRHIQHGPKERNHENIAILWNAFLELKAKKLAVILDAWDVATMMELLKVARRFTGEGRTNPDNYIDGAGYCGVAGEIALNGKEVR